MKSSHPVESARSASAQYAPSVPMTVYRELAAELRANKAVIDSLNDRNQQLLQQNQLLKREIHNVVQAASSLSQAAGIPAPANPQNFPAAIAPDTLARLVRDEREQPAPFDYYEQSEPIYQAPMPVPIPTNHRPQPISQSKAREKSREKAREKTRDVEQRSEKRPIAKKVIKKAASAPKSNGIDQNLQKIAKRQKAVKQAIQRSEPTKQRAPKAVPPAQQVKPRVPKKLFTEQAGEMRYAPESEEIKEIGGIWLVLSIILIIVTAFGAGFLIMKPLLGDR